MRRRLRVTLAAVVWASSPAVAPSSPPWVAVALPPPSLLAPEEEDKGVTTGMVKVKAMLLASACVMVRSRMRPVLCR